MAKLSDGGTDTSLKPCGTNSVPVSRLAFEKTKCVRAPHGNRTTTAAGIAEWIGKMYGCRVQEFGLALFLNPRTEIIAVQEVGMGGFDTAPIDPRVLFSGALLAGASAFIFVHNHPSGDPEPSGLDVALTQQLSNAAKLLGIRFLDHIIIGRGGQWSSFQQRGRMPGQGTGLGSEDIKYGE